MQKTLFYKLAAIGMLSALLLIPLAMIKDTIKERQLFRVEARNDIARSWSEAQNFTGPVLILPYTETVEAEIYDAESGKTVKRPQERERSLALIPDQLLISGQVDTEERYRGIHSVPVYTANLKVSGHFTLPGKDDPAVPDGKIKWQEAYVALGVSDIRGIKRQVTLSWNGENKAFLPGAKTDVVKNGLHAKVGEIKPDSPQPYTFTIEISLRGMESLSFTPIGKDTQVTLASAWQHPSFTGRFLPESRDVSETGFKAQWQMSDFSTNISEAFSGCLRGTCHALNTTQFGVSLYSAVDIYQQAERSLKYDFLFIGLTFIAFFLFEILKRLPIHPIQYALVGVALALFYLLLVALSEHIAFAMAYVLAASACVALLAFYMSYVMRSAKRGVGLGGLLGLLYGVLYVLIRSEDVALLMGALLIFGILALIMVITRKVDWYQTGNAIMPSVKIE